MCSSLLCSAGIITLLLAAPLEINLKARFNDNCYIILKVEVITKVCSMVG